MRLSLRASMIVAVSASGAGIGCGPPPVYDDTLGIEGVPVDVGALAGTFAWKSVLTDQADTVLGPVEAGGMTFFLTTRTWDALAGVYQQSMQPCDVVNFEVAGLSTTIPGDTTQKITPIANTLVVDHDTGAWHVPSFQEIWGLRDFPQDEALPTDPTDPRIIDVEPDDKPGFTITASGLVSGELYAVQRKTISYDGVVRGDDGGVGLAHHVKEGTVLGATNDLLKSQASRSQHPDPKTSWVYEVRLPDGATCSDVLQARDDDTLPRLTPF